MKLKQRFIGGGIAITFICTVCILFLFKLSDYDENSIPLDRHFGAATDANNRHELRSSDTTENISNELSPEGRNPWDVWNTWVNPDYLYPITGFESSEMKLILKALTTSPVVSFGLGHKGTQLKTSMNLLEQQRTVFKPMRYDSMLLWSQVYICTIDCEPPTVLCHHEYTCT